jgi:hypothetical protein
MTRQDNIRQDKTRQCKDNAGQDKTTQDKTISHRLLGLEERKPEYPTNQPADNIQPDR